MEIIIQQEDCINTEVALRKEWLDTNGLGGYSSSTIIGCHTRKYHGLLVASLKKPAGTFVLLSKVEASLIVNGKEFLLSTNKYPGVFFPTGHEYIDSFSYEHYPITTYRIGDVVFRKSLVMLEGMNSLLIRYDLLESSSPVILRLKPLLAYRTIHALTHENISLNVRSFPEKNGCKIEPYPGMPPLYLSTSSDSTFYPGPIWHKDIEYLKEQRRGYPYKEDLFSPGIFEIPLKNQNDVILAASVESIKNDTLETRWKQEVARRVSTMSHYAGDSPHLQQLKYIAKQFLIKNRQEKASLVAGYHWFGEWGRDAMIALPGLTFYCDRMEAGVEILKTFAQREKNGLLPNYLAENRADDAYNAGDVSLWFFWTIQEYLRCGGTLDVVKEHFFATMNNIIKALLEGTSPHFTLLNNGLLELGDETTQLTWMDAQAYGKPVTPRNGCPVEINALWYNTLCFWKKLCDDIGIATHTLVESTRAKIDSSFVTTFWNEEKRCLADVVNKGWQDTSIRPNQIFALSLPYSALPQEKQRAVIETVTHHLLTPYGIRTLSPTDEKYHPYYEGNPDARDSAYHQGTVWPWLVGHFAEGYLKTAETFESGCNFLRQHLKPLLEEFPQDFGIAAIPEIYNGNPPHKPKGTISQAWSCAEIIRLETLIKTK